MRAAMVIFDYKQNFPKLFQNLERLPHQPVYNADELLGGDGKKKTEEITAWLAAQPYFKMRLRSAPPRCQKTQWLQLSVPRTCTRA